MHLYFMIISGLISLAGIGLAYRLHLRDRAAGDALPGKFPEIDLILQGKYFIDELYDAVLGKPLLWLSDRVVLRLGDRLLLDGSLNGMAKIAQAGAGVLSRLQDGSLQRYVGFVLIGSTACLLWILRHG